VIGTLARLATEAGMEVMIVSGDKDFAQLISDQVRMVDTLRDVTYDPELVRKKWGVPPEHFADFLGLVGDKSDAIPGVPGIGRKTAARLLGRYGSLEAILEHREEVAGRAGSALEKHADDARLSRELATIDRRVPLQLGLDDLRLELPSAEELNALYRKLEFFSLLTAEAAADGEHGDPDADYGWCRSPQEVSRFLASLPADAPAAVFPLYDRPSPVRGTLAGLALCGEPGVARWVPLFGRDGLGEEGLGALAEWLGDPDRPKMTYDAKALDTCLARCDLDLSGVGGDVLLESFLVDPTGLVPHRLSQVTKEYLQRALPPAKVVTGSGRRERPFSDLEAETVASWVCLRCDTVLRLAPVVRRRLEEEGQLENLERVELPLSFVLAEMERAGILVDREDLERMGRELRERLEDIAAVIYRLAGRELNLRSPKQLGEVLFDELGLPVIKRTKTGYSTDAEVLERLAEEHEIAVHVLEHRKLAKLIHTYTDVLQREVNAVTGRIHATFQQTVGATGRLITTDPDLQRTPIKSPEGRRIRRAFVAPAGHRLISADWSQIELRLLAHFSGDPRLVEAFSEGRDVHRQTAADLFGCLPEEVDERQRGIGKVVNFATIYGQGATALGKLLGTSRDEAQRTIDAYFELYGGVRRWVEGTVAEAYERGYVTTLLGRRRYVPELSSNSFVERQTGERIAANTPIQGSAADLCKLAMLAVHAALRKDGFATRMLLQVHDELVFEAPEGEVEAVCALVERAMRSPQPLRVPLEVEVGVGRSWAEAH
jgi:DNA polymerase-1